MKHYTKKYKFCESCGNELTESTKYNYCPTCDSDNEEKLYDNLAGFPLEEDMKNFRPI